MNIKYNKVINRAASATFGVYLIHDCVLIRPILWNTIFRNSFFQDSIIIIPYSVLAVVIVYSICTGIDLCRQCTVERVVMKLAEEKIDNLSNTVNPLLVNILSRHK